MNTSITIWLLCGILTLLYSLRKPYNKHMSGMGDVIACVCLVIAWPILWSAIGVRLITRILSSSL